MKVLTKILLGVAIFLLLIIGTLLLAPVLFKDQIVKNVRTSVNRMVDAEVDFADIDVSFLRSFPDVSVNVEEVSVVGIDTFSGLPLMSADQVGIDLGFWSVVGGDGQYNLAGLRLEKPALNLVTFTPELANYLIVPDTAPSSTESAPAAAPLTISLEKFVINDGHLIYDDRSADTYLEIKGLNTTGLGDFTTTVFDVDTYSEAEGLTLRQGGITYLNEVRTVADAVVNVDSENMRFVFRENNVKLNALELEFDGSIDMQDNDDVLFDLIYTAPGGDFRQVWSMIPSAYTEGFEQVKTTGAFTLNGTVSGTYNAETERLPAFTVNADIRDGSVQYPGRPLGLNNIAAKVGIISPASDLDQLKMDISSFAFQLGGDPFSGSFRLATPLSDPDIDATLQGKLDLEKWAKAIPLEGIRELSGVIIADVLLQNVRQSVIDAGNYAQVNMGGEINIHDFVYVAEDLPPVRVPQATANFSPRAIDIPLLTVTLGRSDVSGSASITTPLAYFNPEQTMRGTATIKSDFLDADEWITPSEPSATAPTALGLATVPTDDSEVFDRFDFDLDATIKQLQYGTYRPENLRAVGNIKPNALEIAMAEGTLGSSSFTAAGNVNNLFEYTFGDGTLTGDLSVRSDFIDMADFMVEDMQAAAPTTDAEGSTAAIPIPHNIDLEVDLVAGRVKYDDINLTKVQGRLLMQGGQAVIEDGTTNIFGGRMDFSGAYDTSVPDDPGFRFHYDMKGIDFSQAFGKLNTFAQLAPVGKYLDGKFNTDLILEGKLGDDLFPKLSSIDAKGLFKTFNTRVNGLEPLQKIGQTLNINQLKGSTTLKNIVTFFSVENGRVAVEPFNLTVADIPMSISGSHGLNQDMDYQIRAAIPRDMIGGNAIGGAALSALDALAGKVSGLGIDLQPGDVINVLIGLTGSLDQPKTSFKFLGTEDSGISTPTGGVVSSAKEQIKDEIENRKEEMEARAQAQIDSLSQVAGERAQAMKDSIKRSAELRANELRRQAEEKLRLRLDSIRLDSIKNALPAGVRKEVDRIKDELGRFNPFKKDNKKKKDN